MIEEQAQVIEIKGNRLLLQAQTQSACGNCSLSKGCGTSLLAKVVGRKFTHFQAENNINAKVGDTVVVGIAEDALLKGSVMMYILPVVCMLIFALLADYFLVEAIQYRDLMIAASSFMGLVFGSLMSKWYFDRQSSVKRFVPVVLRKIIEHAKLPSR
jgi:sigma-E factor negative regulatory protein RseC